MIIDEVKHKLEECGYEYINGYVNCESVVKLRCKQCNNIFEYNYHRLTSKHKGKNKCPHCREQKITNKKISNMLLKQSARLEKQKQRKLEMTGVPKLPIYVKECKQCGISFITSNKERVNCSSMCLKKFQNSKRHNRYKGITLDKDITLDKLFKRDNGYCALCGGLYDKLDYKEEKGTIICGGYYPSIDHIKPISKGGLHCWDNVQLTHIICNTMKSNIF